MDKRLSLKIKDFTEDEVKRLHCAMQSTWDAIAYDILACNDGKDMPRSLVIEVVLDADYMEMYGGHRPEDKALIQRFRQLDYKDMIKMARDTFIDKRYGY